MEELVRIRFRDLVGAGVGIEGGDMRWWEEVERSEAFTRQVNRDGKICPRCKYR